MRKLILIKEVLKTHRTHARHETISRLSSTPPDGIVKVIPAFFLQTLGHWHVYHNGPKLEGGFVYHNRPMLERGFCHKEAQYPIKPAEAGWDLGGQREKGKTSHPTKKKMGNSSQLPIVSCC